jgi:hypothetical protein
MPALGAHPLLLALTSTSQLTHGRYESLLVVQVLCCVGLNATVLCCVGLNASAGLLRGPQCHRPDAPCKPPGQALDDEGPLIPDSNNGNVCAGARWAPHQDACCLFVALTQHG